jgi:hypothetical protein
MRLTKASILSTNNKSLSQKNKLHYMKKITTHLLLLISVLVSAQERNKAQIKDFFWGSQDEHKKTIAVPDKWKDESAVILFKQEFYDYHKFGRSVNYTSAIRNRIKLQDLNSVKEYSEFSFKDKFFSQKGLSFKKGTNTIGIKVVKPNGKEVEIDVDKEAKDIEKEKKIAVSNLEVGDIIDYYIYSEEPFLSVSEFGFDPVETTLGDVYPIADMQLIFQTENDFFVNFSSYNGAPDLKEVKTNKSGERRYELIAKDIEKNDFPRWFYPLSEMACYKFQVFFARSGKFEKRADAFLPEKEDIIKKKVSKDDIFNYYNDKFRPFGDMVYIEKFLKGKKFASDEEKVREVYYFTRHNYLTQYIEAFVADEAKIFYPYELYKNPIFFRTETDFINHFMAFLKDFKIDYDLIVGTERYNGSIDDILIQQNASILLRVNTTPKPLYLEFFNSFSSADQFNHNLENTKAYVLEVSKGKRIVNAETVTLPSSSIMDNIIKTTTNVVISDDFSSLKLNKESSFSGQCKTSEQKDKLYFFDYVNEDYKKYESVPLLDRVKNKNKNAQYTKEMDAVINKLKDKQKEAFKKTTGDDYELEIDDHSLKIINTGRFGKNTPFVYQEDFTIKNNLIKQTGSNYIVEIGKFLTSQIDIDKKERERKNNVYMSFPRSLENEITLTIPTGYTVSSLEKLNKNVENQTGKFTSVAVLTGNKLTIKTTKQYNNYYEPNSNWSKMVLFLDAAYQFTQEKILLKKA